MAEAVVSLHVRAISTGLMISMAKKPSQFSLSTLW